MMYVFIFNVRMHQNMLLQVVNIGYNKHVIQNKR
jgi:hypothetical protein